MFVRKKDFEALQRRFWDLELMHNQDHERLANLAAELGLSLTAAPPWMRPDRRSSIPHLIRCLKALAQHVGVTFETLPQKPAEVVVRNLISISDKGSADVKS